MKRKVGALQIGAIERCLIYRTERGAVNKIQITKKLRMEAKIEEYEHAMRHVATCNRCSDCTRLVQGALDGISREDFLESVLWDKGLLEGN